MCIVTRTEHFVVVAHLRRRRENERIGEGDDLSSIEYTTPVKRCYRARSLGVVLVD